VGSGSGSSDAMATAFVRVGASTGELGRRDAMRLEAAQGLGWWRYDAEEVVHHVRSRLGLSPTEARVVGALPPPLLQAGCGAQKRQCWADSFRVITPVQGRRRGGLQRVEGGGEVHADQVLERVRLLALSGEGASRQLTKAPLFGEERRTRARLAALGVLLRRVAVRPGVHCRSAWAGRRRAGGVALLRGRCVHGRGNGTAGPQVTPSSSGDADAESCCSALFPAQEHQQVRNAPMPPPARERAHAIGPLPPVKPTSTLAVVVLLAAPLSCDRACLISRARPPFAVLSCHGAPFGPSADPHGRP